MTRDEIERKARAEYEAARTPGETLRPWADLAEFRKDFWRELVEGDASAAEGWRVYSSATG